MYSRQVSRRQEPLCFIVLKILFYRQRESFLSISKPIIYYERAWNLNLLIIVSLYLIITERRIQFELLYTDFLALGEGVETAHPPTAPLAVTLVSSECRWVVSSWCPSRGGMWHGWFLHSEALGVFSVCLFMCYYTFFFTGLLHKLLH